MSGILPGPTAEEMAAVGKPQENAGKPPTFRAWIKTQRKRRDAVGDLARDVWDDLSCWKGTSARHLLLHMIGEHDAIPAATKALGQAWAEYREATE